MKNKSAKKRGKKEKKREKGKKETNTQTNKQTKKWYLLRKKIRPGLDSNQSYPLLHSNHLESSIMVQRYGIGPRPFSLSLHEIDVRIDTLYATPCV